MHGHGILCKFETWPRTIHFEINDRTRWPAQVMRSPPTDKARKRNQPPLQLIQRLRPIALHISSRS